MRNRFVWPEVSRVVVLAVCAATLSLATDRRPEYESYSSGRLKGFFIGTGIVMENKNPIVVRNVAGRIFDGKNNPLPNAAFQLRGPGGSQRVRTTFTDDRGRFKLSGMPPGHYEFVATLRTWSSVHGTLVVDKKADPKTAVTIELPQFVN